MPDNITHEVGCLVKEDVVLLVEGVEQSAIAAHIVTDGVDGCRVGYTKI